jgi:CheY-like chemotaxis protein
MERTASILVIEAHLDCRDVLVMTLEACEFAAMAVANGGDALAVGGVDGTRTRDPRRDRPVF